MPSGLPVVKSPESFLPLSQTHYYILVSLLSGSKHGYAILKDIESLSKQTVVIAVGNLYVGLKQLSNQGLIEQIEGNKRHKVYRLSGLGERTLEAEIRRLRRMLRAANRGC